MEYPLSNFLVVYAISWVISESSLLEVVRAWAGKKSRLAGDLLYCQMCTSFWVAVAYTNNLWESFIILAGVVIINKLLSRGIS